MVHSHHSFKFRLYAFMLDFERLKAYSVVMKRKTFIKKIESAGWTFLREGGNHSIYQKKGRTFQVPRHNEVPQGLVWQWERINKQLDDSS